MMDPYKGDEGRWMLMKRHVAVKATQGA